MLTGGFRPKAIIRLSYSVATLWAMHENSPYALSSSTIAGIVIAYLAFILLILFLYAP